MNRNKTKNDRSRSINKRKKKKKEIQALNTYQLPESYVTDKVALTTSSKGAATDREKMFGK